MLRTQPRVRSYPAGDPGIFGSIAKVFGGVAKEFVPGAKVASGVIKGIKSVKRRKGKGKTRRGPRGMKAAAFPAFSGVQRMGVGVAGAAQSATRPDVRDGTTVQRDDILVTACPPGHHPNKSSYFRMSPGGTLVFQPPGTTCVKNRRRNPLNPRAFDRALSRVGSAKKFGEKLSRVTIRRKACK